MLKINIKDLLNFLRFKKKTGLYKYKSYEEYKKVQIAGNIAKLNNVYAREDDIKFLSNYLKQNLNNINFGICHGTRRGLEQQWFRKYLGKGVEVIGTEISPTANDFSYTIQWDFHDVKEEWLDNVDFIYSNSFDHSYKPEECLNAWMSCVKKNGLLILEWSKHYVESRKLDPFGATLAEYKKLINKKYNLKEILKSPKNKLFGGLKKYFLIVEHKKKINNT